MAEMASQLEHDLSKLSKTSLDGSMQVSINYDFILRVQNYLETRRLG